MPSTKIVVTLKMLIKHVVSNVFGYMEYSKINDIAKANMGSVNSPKYKYLLCLDMAILSNGGDRLKSLRVGSKIFVSGCC